jgi:hypothetical protein
MPATLEPGAPVKTLRARDRETRAAVQSRCDPHEVDASAEVASHQAREPQVYPLPATVEPFEPAAPAGYGGE